MTHMRYSDGKTTVKRITKQAAKKIYNAGGRILICPNKWIPLNKFWGMECWLQNNVYDNFETMCNRYSYYNCNHETGYYLAYYVEEA